MIRLYIHIIFIKIKTTFRNTFRCIQGLALWPQQVNGQLVMAAAHIRKLILICTGPFLTQLPTNVPRRAVEDGSSTWAPETTRETRREFTSWILAWMWLLQPFGEYTSKWKIILVFICPSASQTIFFSKRTCPAVYNPIK